MRAVNLLIICGTLLSLGVPLIKAEVGTGESLGRKGGSTRHTHGLQRMPKVRTRGVVPEGDMPTDYSQAQQSHRLLDQADMSGEGEAYQPLLRKARVLTGSSGSRSSSSSSGSRSSSSSSRSSSSSSSRSSSSSPPRSSWGSWFSPSSGSRSSSPGATQARAAPAVPSKPSQSKAATQSTPAKGTAQPRSSYVPPSYHGPTVRSASGATVVSNRLTTGYPTAGVSSRIPRGYGVATSAPRQTFYASRPYTHTYPRGYTLVFVSAHSPYYTGNHWAIYDDNNDFYGYDDDDVTIGDYDYEDDHGLPPGCQYLNPQSSETFDTSGNSASARAPSPADADGSGRVSAPASAPGSAVAAAAAPVQATAPSAKTGGRALLSVNPSYTASAPAPVMAPGNATSANAPGPAAPSSDSADMQGQGNLLCRPIAAKEDAPSGMSRNTKIILAVVVPVAVLLVLLCICWACAHAR